MTDRWPLDDARVVAAQHRPAVKATTAPWPTWFAEAGRDRLIEHGIAELWRHQVEAAEAAYAGQHVAISTGTASGKSLAYLLPILAATAGLDSSQAADTAEVTDSARVRRRIQFTGTRNTALYLSPTKALAHDQLRHAQQLGPPGWGVTVVDGDTESQERKFARDYASMVLTNPDLVHRTLLPQHERWRSFLAGLRYVVIDEAHHYRGVFGSHVAMVLRRLRRIAAHYGADPVVISASATAVDAVSMTATLLGVEPRQVVGVDHDASPQPQRDFLLWRPDGPLFDESADLLSRLVSDGKQTAAFVRSRRGAEVVSQSAAARTDGKVAAYRGGLLPYERRRLEHDLRAGDLRGVAATNALELGVDISGLDAVVIAGFPGSLASLWQQAGRAGRTDSPALVVLAGSEDPLDAYLFDHPDEIFDADVEPVVLDPDNPAIAGPHLCAAAQEVPLTADDQQWFSDSMFPILDVLTSHAVLRRRPHGWFWTHRELAASAIDLRSTGGEPVQIVDPATGRVVGTADAATAQTTLHPGAVYLHLGEPWRVTSLDLDQREAFVEPFSGHYRTQPITTTEVAMVSTLSTRPLGTGSVSFGVVDVTTEVTGYVRRDLDTDKVIAREPLSLPPRTLQTRATWFTMPHPNAMPTLGSAHAAEHTLAGLLPVFARNDHADVRSAAYGMHPDTGALTVVLFDAHPGGSGYAAAGYAQAGSWVHAAIHRLEHCECSDGCPRCVVSPRCPSGNDPLDKAGATALLRWLLADPDEIAAGAASRVTGSATPSVTGTATPSVTGTAAPAVAAGQRATPAA